MSFNYLINYNILLTIKYKGCLYLSRLCATLIISIFAEITENFPYIFSGAFMPSKYNPFFMVMAKAEVRANL